MKNDDVAGIIENEGLGYALECYTDGLDFEDEQLKELWTQGRKALQAIRDYLDINIWNIKNYYTRLSIWP